MAKHDPHTERARIDVAQLKLAKALFEQSTEIMNVCFSQSPISPELSQFVGHEAAKLKSNEAETSYPQLDARVDRLERDAMIADFFRAERKREWAITQIIVQFGVVLAGAIYAAEYFGWISHKLVAPDSPLVGLALLLLVIATGGHALSSIRDLFRTRRAERSAYSATPAE